jgi:hypothetical protein
MGRILLLLSLCLFSSCYPYPPPHYSGNYQPYPPGYWTSYPGYSPANYASYYGPQDYGPYDQQHYQEYGQPGYATSTPTYGRPTYLTPPSVGHGQPPQGYDQPTSSLPPHDQTQPEYYGGRQGGDAGPPDCDSPTNPMACN